MNIEKSKSGKSKKAIGIAMAAVMVTSIFVILTPAAFGQPSVPPEEDGIYYLVPRDSNATHGNNQTIDVWVNTTRNITAGTVKIETSDKSCANITGGAYNSTEWTLTGSFVIKEKGRRIVLGYGDMPGTVNPPGVYPLGNITVHCNSTTPCVANLNFAGDNYIVDPQSEAWVVLGQNGTFTCTAPPETFNKQLLAGWNLISLPLTNDTDMTVSNIIDTSLSGKYDALYKYDATAHSYVAMGSSDTMENGVGYFINMTADDTWTYSGSAYMSMSEGLSEGLNMVGWLNCSKDIVSDGALSSIDGNYYYVASWNATSQSYETYNPVAPPVFNDFTTMDRGEGYFISMKAGDTLAENCGA